MFVTVHHQYNDVSNQQYATTFPFIKIYKSALHVSGDKFSHPQEHFCLYTQFWYNASTLLPTGATVEMERQFHLNLGTGRQQCRCIVPNAVYTEKSAPEDGRIRHPKHVGLIWKD